MWLTPGVTALRILLDKNVPVGVHRFLSGHEVRTFVDMHWDPQLENGVLLREAEAAGFDVIMTSDQNIAYQQHLTGRTFALVVLGSNTWPIVHDDGASIRAKVEAARPRSYAFIEMPLPPKPQRTVAL